MSGHSKWSTIKRQKGAADAKRSLIFSQMAKLITIAAKSGGDPASNFTLRMAIERARSVNMPKDNIERAIKRGTGELQGYKIEELIYEGFGPAQTQFIVKCLTDNKNRTASNIRHIFAKHGGSLGSVAWNFSQKGVIVIANDKLIINNLDMDEFELALIDAGAQDIKQKDKNLIVYTKIEDLQKVKKFLDEKNIETNSAEIEYVAKEEKKPAQDKREKIEQFIKELEEDEDVGDYYSNIAASS